MSDQGNIVFAGALEQTSLQQKAAFYQYLNNITILPSDMLSCLFDFHLLFRLNPCFTPIHQLLNRRHFEFLSA